MIEPNNLTEFINDFFPDLKKVLAQEWSIRKELEQEKLDQMKREREQYEEDLRYRLSKY